MKTFPNWCTQSQIAFPTKYTFLPGPRLSCLRVCAWGHLACLHLHASVQPAWLLCPLHCGAGATPSSLPPCHIQLALCYTQLVLQNKREAKKINLMRTIMEDTTNIACLVGRSRKKWYWSDITSTAAVAHSKYTATFMNSTGCIPRALSKCVWSLVWLSVMTTSWVPHFFCGNGRMDWGKVAGRYILEWRDE